MDTLYTNEVLIEPYTGFNDLVEDIKKDIPPRAQQLFFNWSQPLSGKEHIIPKTSKLQRELQKQFVEYVIAKVIEGASSYSSAVDGKRYADQVKETVLYPGMTRIPEKEKIPKLLGLTRMGEIEQRTLISQFLSDNKLQKDEQIDMQLLDTYIGIRHFELTLAQVDAAIVNDEVRRSEAYETDQGLLQIMSKLKQDERIKAVGKSGFAAVGLRAALCISEVGDELIKVDEQITLPSQDILKRVVSIGDEVSKTYDQVVINTTSDSRPDLW